jgi:coenzyme F420-reducing hydrogenase alpha subunit
MKHRTIKVDYLSRVEGEGGLLVRIKDGQVIDTKFKIFEPPRMFEAFMRGRRYEEAPDVTARICGICPIAYQMSAVHAMEHACGVTVEGQLRALRRLLYCGEWIESHALHVYMLHAPDFLGYADGIEMARDHEKVIRRGLRLKKIGNDIVSLLGGREIHPINVRLGGFHRVPEEEELKPLADSLAWAEEAAIETVRWSSTLPFPDFERDYEFVSLRHPHEYPLNEGRIVSGRGLDMAVDEYEQHFTEEHVEHSTSLHATLEGREFFCGPLARLNLNFDRFTPTAQQAAREAGIAPPYTNPFKSIIARSVEILYACEEAQRIVREYRRPDQPSVNVVPREAIGHGCTEAPRGLLYHKYRIDSEGIIQDARIVPPTSQNQKSIEGDLQALVPQLLDLSKDDLTARCEQAVRNYDPCISCSTHLLRIEV